MNSDSLTLSFPIRNRSNRTISIQRINSTCGCTKVEIGSMVLEPGHGTEVKVSVEEKSPISIQRPVSLLILTDDPITPRYVVGIRAVFMRDVEVLPGDLHFGTIQQSEGSGTMDVVIMSSEPTADLTVDVQDLAIGVRVLEQSTELHQNGVVRYRTSCRVQVQPDHKVGKLSTALVLRSKAFGETPLKIPVSGCVQARFVATPSVIVLDRHASMKIVTFKLSDMTGEPVAVQSIIAPPGLSVEPVEARDASIHLEIRIADESQLDWSEETIMVAMGRQGLECAIPIYLH